MPNTYKLTYFNLAGRAETIRLIFAAGGVSFQDNRIDGAAWGALKPTTPWGGVPILEVNGRVVVGQSISIARYVARETGLAGKNSLDQALVDSVADTITELLEKLFTFIRSTDEAHKAAATNDYITNFLPQYLTNIDKFLGANNGGKGFLVGDKMTWADIHLFNCLDIIKQMVPAAAAVISKYPRVEQLAARVAATPKIAEYLKKRSQ